MVSTATRTDDCHPEEVHTAAWQDAESGPVSRGGAVWLLALLWGKTRLEKLWPGPRLSCSCRNCSASSVEGQARSLSPALAIP